MTPPRLKMAERTGGGSCRKAIVVSPSGRSICRENLYRLPRERHLPIEIDRPCPATTDHDHHLIFPPGARSAYSGLEWQPHVAVTSAISLVEQCILDCVQRYGDTCYYLLCGDFNARTGDLNSVPPSAEDTDDLMHLVVAERLESKHLPVELKLNPGNAEGQKVTGTVEKLRWDDRKR
ncbi:hypothetical protein BaRGS_00015835, partial [Batillaria attramentaria]